MAQIEDHGTYVIKTETPGLPEAEKYQALNAANAPVVRLLDVLEEKTGRKIVLEKADPLGFDPAREPGFSNIVEWLVEFNATTAAYPPCNLDYVESYWTVTAELFALAQDPTSPIYRPAFATLPSAAHILAQFKRLVATDTHTTISHGDPANANLGIIKGKVVAFDLELSWRNSPFVDLALRTGAQTTPYPEDLDREALLETYATRLSIASTDPLREYAICGAIYGAYFEQAALNELLTNQPTPPTLSWANLTLDRYQAFASPISP